MAGARLLLTALLLIGITCGQKVPSSRRHYVMKITEAGETFEETDDMDIDDNMEAIHVPAHNDIKEATFVIDHNKHLTMRLIAGTNRCLLSPAGTNAIDERGQAVDEPVSSEAEVLSQQQGRRAGAVSTETHTYEMGDRVRDSERNRLSPVMQRLCDGRDIYRLKPMDDVMAVEGESEVEAGPDVKKPKREEGFLERLVRHYNETLVDPCPGAEPKKRCKANVWDCRYSWFYDLRLLHYTCNSTIKPGSNKGNMRQHCFDGNRIHSLDKVLCCKHCCNVYNADNLLLPCRGLDVECN